MSSTKPRAELQYFATPAALRSWFARHHADATELQLGYWKVGSGRPSVSWPESVDEALCVGWIDSVRHRIDDERYTIRFTPRRPGSIWSAVNIARVKALEAEGRMTDAGRAAFAARKDHKSSLYSYEQRGVDLPPEYEQVLRRHRTASKDFHARPASYRKAAVWWVVSAKQEATRQRRLQTLIDCCAQGKTIPAFLAKKT